MNVRWFFNIKKWSPTQEEMLQITRYIQPEEKERLGRFYFKEDFKSSLIGRLLMRKFISEVSTTPYNEIVLIRDGKGKPILFHPSREDIKFNVSHQGDFVVLAGSIGNMKLGIDVMKLVELKGGKKRTEYFQLMRKQFSDSEWKIIEQGSDNEQLFMFSRLWSLKESYVKALGVGITVDLKSISFNILTRNLNFDSIVNDTELYLNGKQQEWVFQEMLLDEKHCVSVAIDNKSSGCVHFKELFLNEVIQRGVPILEEDSEYCYKYFQKDEKS